MGDVHFVEGGVESVGLAHGDPIDGQPTIVLGVSTADGWLARASPRPDVTVYIESHRLTVPAFVDRYHVIKVTDLVPYLEGRVAMLSRMRH